MDMIIMQMMEKRDKNLKQTSLVKDSIQMSCLWKCWEKQNPIPPSVLPDAKVENPLNLNEIPNTVVELRAFEGALIHHLISIHYKIEDTKRRIAIEFQSGRTDRARALIAKNTHLFERKMLFETRLERVQKKLAALR